MPQHFSRLAWVGIVLVTQSAFAQAEDPAAQYQWYEQTTRLLSQPASRKAGINQLQKRYRGVLQRIQLDRVLSQERWEYSWNYDELVKAEIVQPAVLDALGIPHRVEAGRGTQTAGLMHSYGYLFSLLETSFGRKGKRWVEARLDERLGLKAGEISIAPTRGSFLGNLTRTLDRLSGSSAHRLETVHLQQGKKVLAKWEVATFLVPLRAVEGTATPDTQLLFYGVKKAGKRHWSWVTAFPILDGFADAIRAERFDAQAPESNGPKDFTARFNWNPRLKAGQVLRLQKVEFTANDSQKPQS